MKKIDFKNIDLGKVAGVATSVLSVAGLILGGISEKSEKQKMKDDIKNEILKEMEKNNQ